MENDTGESLAGRCFQERHLLEGQVGTLQKPASSKHCVIGKVLDQRNALQRPECSSNSFKTARASGKGLLGTASGMVICRHGDKACLMEFVCAGVHTGSFWGKDYVLLLVSI